jgi:hypothetical protein
MFSAMRARMTNYKLNFEENLMGRGSDYFRLYLRYNPANDAYTGIVDATQIPGDTLPAGQKLETSLEIRRRLKIR